ncbi:MAG: hypothetical protein K2Z81_26860, partial [Cyanobacteria bacterium]|nr:hypothetical protein [Cyanobacteriota bacterium]
MIECPICQVMNEDVALFCAECGQRFGPTVAKDVGVADVVEEPAAVPTSLSNKPARLKLHSPILGGSGGAEPEMDNYSSGYDKPQMSKLRGAPAPRNTYEEESHSNPSGHTPPKRGLRSPLLGGEDDNNVEYDD